MKAIHERLQKYFDVIAVSKNTVYQIDAQNARGLLLELVVVVQHFDVDNEVVGFAARFELKTQPEPTFEIGRAHV